MGSLRDFKLEICRPFPPWFEGNFSEELSLYCYVYAGNDGSNCLCLVYYVVWFELV